LQRGLEEKSMRETFLGGEKGKLEGGPCPRMGRKKGKAAGEKKKMKRGEAGLLN